MNTQRATNKNVPTANFFEKDFRAKILSDYSSKIIPWFTGENARLRKTCYLNVRRYLT